MTATLADYRDAIALLPKRDQAQMVASVVAEVREIFPGIAADAGVCGAGARIARTWVPSARLEAGGVRADLRIRRLPGA